MLWNGIPDAGVPLSDWLHRRTLILGEVNAGKTRLTDAIATRMVREGLDPQMVVLDLAPVRVGGVGGRLVIPDPGRILYFTTVILPPRLTGRTPREVEALARANARAIRPLIERCLAARRPILVVNDLTLYLHAGEPEAFHALLAGCETAVVNAYLGRTLGDSAFSRRERNRTERLLPRFDRVVHLPAPDERGVS